MTGALPSTSRAGSAVQTRFPPTSAYSAAHYEAVGGALPILTAMTRSSSTASPSCHGSRFAMPSSSRKRAPRAPARKIRRARPTGCTADRWCSGCSNCSTPAKRMSFSSPCSRRVVDEFNRFVEWRPQLEGGKTGRELPAIVDQIVTMQWVDFGDGKPVRAFVCTSPNPWGYPAKDRSGRLEQLEPPDLGKLSPSSYRPRAARPKPPETEEATMPYDYSRPTPT